MNAASTPEQTAVAEPTQPDAGWSAEVDGAPARVGGFISNPILVAAVLSIATTAAGLAVYHALYPPAAKLGMVDLPEILEIKQMQLAQQISKPGATQADIQAAFQGVAQFGKQVEGAIGELQDTCQCTLLVRGAVLARNVHDYTGALKKQLGMEGLTVALMSQMAAPAPSKADLLEGLKQPLPGNAGAGGSLFPGVKP